jgi:succinate-semialdehyde dehydrogenase/glutarate-semialdehyde dehydrogenase
MLSPWAPGTHRRQTTPASGFFFEPTVLADVPMEARIMQEEPFGPIAVMRPFDTLEDGLAEANRLPYALSAYAFTRDARTVLDVAMALKPE